MRSTVAYSEKLTASEAFEEICVKIENDTAGVCPAVIIFASDGVMFAELSKSFREKFPDSVIIGTTSGPFFCSEGNGQKAVNAMAVTDGLEIAAGVITDIKKNPMSFSGEIAAKMNSLTSKENCCLLEFCTAFTDSEERIMDTFRSVIADERIPLAGSTAWGVGTENNSMVSLNGEVFESACVYAFIRNVRGKILILKENMYMPTVHHLVATDVDCDERAVYEFNNRPAVVEIANALKVPIPDLKDHLLEHPLGRISKDKVYITDFDRIRPDGSITYRARIYNHSKVVLMEPNNYDKVWNRTAQNVNNKIGKPSFTIVINCISRTRLFLEKGRFSDFADVLSNSYGTYWGISGMGEQYDFVHMNQTMLLIAFE